MAARSRNPSQNSGSSFSKPLGQKLEPLLMKFFVFLLIGFFMACSLNLVFNLCNAKFYKYRREAKDLFFRINSSLSDFFFGRLLSSAIRKKFNKILRLVIKNIFFMIMISWNY